MADDTSYKLRFTWYTVDGDTKTMTLSHPNLNVTSEQAQAVLDAGVNFQPFQDVTLESGANAEIIENTTEYINYTISE